MPPKVSVVMSVYNAGDFLREAVDSVLTQTFEDLEFIIIDDGSKDQSLQTLQEYTDPRIRILTQANRGLIASLNRGILEARGRYIARMDADDRCEPDRLEIQVRYLDHHPDIALLGGSVATMDEQGNPLAPFVGFPLTHEEIWSSVGRRPWVFCHPAVMYRREAAIDVGMYHTGFSHAEDAEFFARLMTKYRAANLPEVLLNYRLCRGGVSLTKLAHGQVNAKLVASIIDRWQPGEPFGPTPLERKAADEEIARCDASTTPAQIESAYQVRLGRELLRAKSWARARRHYINAIRSNPKNRRAYVGLAASWLHAGAEAAGAPMSREPIEHNAPQLQTNVNIDANG
jgi:glycosyltransferase involved in cell wall biosynthesis